ncbi:MAG: DctP family TRAP transporter solute-binding subunit [Peptostreptococcaceae bacterium]|nr:DctP family TRAP transporter solute-binding subunit [Peptostreptococcaceae bacterium]
MKKMFALLLTGLMVFGLASCEDKAAPSGGGGESSGGSETYLIRVGHVLPTNHQTHITLEEVFKKEVEEKSGGKITVEIYPNAQLGGDRKQVESVQIGSLEMCVPAASVVTGFDSDWEILDMPYLFADKETALRNLDGKLGDALNEHLKEKGIVNLGFGENGLRHVINNVRPINSLEDMKGLKIRTMESPMQVEGFKAMGSSPTPISFSELFTALQQKTVDGAECPMNILYANKLYEVQKYISKTGHIYLSCPYLMNKTFYEGLPEDLQKVVADAVDSTVAAQRAALAEDEVTNTKKMEDYGIAINELPEEELQKFKDAMKPVMESYEAKSGRTYLDLIE